MLLWRRDKEIDFQRVDVVYALLFDTNTNKILMVFNKNGTWSLPGGAVEAGETLREATVREVKEETGYDIKVGNIVALNEAIIEKNHVYFITYHGRITKRPEEIPPEGISKLLNESGTKYTLQKNA